MVGKNDEQQTRELVAQIHKAVESGDSQRAAELIGELISFGEGTGQIDEAASRRMRLDLAAFMIRTAPLVREKVTLSLPDDVLKALRLAAAETGREMSLIVTDALRAELQKYHHASQALRKTT